MQNMSTVGTFHREPPSRFTSLDHGHWLAQEIGGQRHQAVILV
jgi:hypothetical protein